MDSAQPGEGKTAVIPNVMAGGRHRGALIPSHQAFIHVKRQSVNSDEWGHGWFGGDDNLYFWLTGDRLTFSARPEVGTPDLDMLPHVRQKTGADPICPAAAEVRPGFLDEPTASNVAAIAEFPADSSIHTTANPRGAVAITVRMPGDSLRITATPLLDSDNVARTLVVTDPEARVIIANVNFGDYITGIGAPDDDHKYLICGMFRPRATRSVPLPAADGDSGMLAVAAEVSPAAALHAAELDRISINALQRAAHRAMSTFLDSLASGCSNSQFP
jgi:hypothetical protein